MVVVHGPERRQVARLHAVEKVLPPAALQVHQALQAPLSMEPHHLQAVGHIRLVEYPSEEESAEDGETFRDSSQTIIHHQRSE